MIIKDVMNNTIYSIKSNEKVREAMRLLQEDNINRLLMSKGEYGGKLLIQLNKIFRPIPLELGGWKLKEVVCNKEICIYQLV